MIAIVAVPAYVLARYFQRLPRRATVFPMTTPSAEVVVTNLHKTFGDQPVLRGLELTVPAGSLTAILGSSGSGKTTLLRIIAGYERPDLGDVTVDGTVFDDALVHLRPESRHIGYVSQEGKSFPAPQRRGRMLLLAFAGAIDEVLRSVTCWMP